MSDHDLAARLDAALGISRPMLVHPSDFEVAEALLLRIELVEDAAIRLMEAVLNDDKHKVQQRAAEDLFRVLLRVKHGHGRTEAAAGNEPAHSGQSVAHSGSFGGWVSVEDGLPETPASVMVALPSGARQLGYYLRNPGGVSRWFSYDLRDNRIEGVAHWTSIPDAPGHEDADGSWIPDAPIARSGNSRAIAGQSSEQSGWIRVADALPDYHDEEVVALAGGQPVLAICSPVGGWRDCYGRRLDGVTHWAWWPGSGSALPSRLPSSPSGSGGVQGSLDLGQVDPEGLGQPAEVDVVGATLPGDPLLRGVSGEAVVSAELGHGLSAVADEVSEGRRSLGHAPQDGASEAKNLQVGLGKAD